MTIGTVKFFNTSKGFGFIAPEGGGKDVFVHATAVEAAGMRSLTENLVCELPWPSRSSVVRQTSQRSSISRQLVSVSAYTGVS